MVQPVLELCELRYSDLCPCSNGSESSRRAEEPPNLETIRSRVVEALGPSGPGLFSVSGVPDEVLQLRRDLLGLSRQLALLHPDHRKRILKEHNLGTDVALKNPDRKVSSFATTLKYGDLGASTFRHENGGDLDFKNLEYGIKKLGSWMMELGLHIARLCDGAVGHELEQSLLDSGTAKGRLIHYHSMVDKFILQDIQGKAKRFGVSGKRGKQSIEYKQGRHCDISDLWQNWHYDYGILTVLTAPLFVLAEDFENESQSEESPCLNEHSCLQIFDPNVKEVQMVKVNPNSFIIQGGEAAALMSNGKLRATLHSVRRPRNLDNLSREMFVVFLQPAWNKVFSVSKDCLLLDIECYDEEDEPVTADATNMLASELRKIVPPLFSRIKDGMTFAEFSRVTTNQYYGGTGLQSK